MATRSVLACASGQLECVKRWPTNTQAATVITAKTTPAVKRRRLGAQAAPAREAILIRTTAGKARSSLSRSSEESERASEPRRLRALTRASRHHSRFWFEPRLALRSGQRPRALTPARARRLLLRGVTRGERDHEEDPEASPRAAARRDGWDAPQASVDPGWLGRAPTDAAAACARASGVAPVASAHGDRLHLSAASMWHRYV